MGMYDSIYCRYPLPGLGVVDDEFQTKDTPGQFLGVYEIRADGTLWRQDYDVFDRSDPQKTGLARFAGMISRENPRWVRDQFRGTIGFYTQKDGAWLEFEGDFVDGVLREIRVCSEEPSSERPRGRFSPQLLESVRQEERESCARVVIERAEEAMASGDHALEMTLRTLAHRIRRGPASLG